MAKGHKHSRKSLHKRRCEFEKCKKIVGFTRKRLYSQGGKLI